MISWQYPDSSDEEVKVYEFASKKQQQKEETKDEGDEWLSAWAILKVARLNLKKPCINICPIWYLIIL